jgi:NADH dehydrogenase [ubiquinone] 1 alpha subcomplex assembly factor 7
VPRREWHHDLSTVPPYGPILLVANEFLDALPVRQLVMTEGGWRERMVGREGDRFVCVAGQPADGRRRARSAARAPPRHDHRNLPRRGGDSL